MCDFVQMDANTWECGTPKSLHSAFNWQPVRDRAKEEQDELRRAKDRARKAKGRQKLQTATARVLRVNPESNIGYSTQTTKSERAPR
jgi:hypothetical protein